jgi:hypothetical protein
MMLAKPEEVPRPTTSSKGAKVALFIEYLLELLWRR